LVAPVSFPPQLASNLVFDRLLTAWTRLWRAAGAHAPTRASLMAGDWFRAGVRPSYMLVDSM